MNDIDIFKKHLLDGNLEGVRNSLQPPFLEIIVDDEGVMRPIHWACNVGNLEIAKLLIDHDVNIEAVDRLGRKPIHWACRQGHLEITELLIKLEPDMESEDGLGRRPIHWACREGNLEIVKLLIEHAVNIEAKDKLCNMTPIHWACLDGYLEVAKLLIQHTVDMECEDKDKRRPIHLACNGGHFEVTELLIQHCVDMECEDGEERRPIHFTITPGHLEITKLLIEYSVDIECEDGLRRRPIHWACRQGHLEIATLLIEEEVDLECEDGQEHRPIHLACMQGHLKIAELLIEHSVDLESKDKYGRRPIHFACMQGNFKLAELLIKKKVIMNCVDEQGWRPIHFACMQGHLKITELLIVNKCAVDHKTKNGSTPLDLAMHNGHDECIKLIQNIIDNNKKIFDCVRSDDDVAVDKLCKSQILVLREYDTQLSVLDVAIKSNANKTIKYLFNRKFDEKEISNLPRDLPRLTQELILYRCIRDNHINGFELVCSANIINGRHRIIQSSFLEHAAKFGSKIFVNEILKKSLYNKNSWQKAKAIAKDKGHHAIIQLISERESILNLREKSHLTILHTAVIDNDADMVQYILDNNLVNPDMNNKKLGTALSLAYSFCYGECIRILEQFKVNPNTYNQYGETPLHEAITSGMIDNCEYLVERADDIDVTGFMGFTSLHTAVINGYSGLCSQLIEKGADWSRSVELNQTSSKLNSDIETEPRELVSTCETVASLCLKYQETIYQSIVSKLNEISANFSDGNENSLLHLSVRVVQPDICERLISAGAIIDPINQEGNTPLLEILSNVDHHKIYHEMDKVIEIVKLLLESGSDISKTTMTGMTVFQCASIHQNQRLMLALVTQQAKLSNVSEEDFKLAFSEKWYQYAEILISRLDKRSLLSYITSDIIHSAMTNAKSTLVKLLFQNASIQVQQSVLEDILYTAVSINDEDLFDHLISDNIRVPKLFENGENLLSTLLKSNKTKYCRKLLQSINGKHFVNLRNAQGQTSLQVAIEMKALDVVDNLIFKSNVMNNEDNDGNTAMTQLFTQISNNDDEIIESRLVGLIKSIIYRGGNIYKVTTRNSQVINCCKNQSVRSDVEEFFKEQQQHVAGPIAERIIEVEKMICTICTVREVDCSLQCGHTFCMVCGQEFVRCPTCNADSTTFKRIFLG